MNFDWLGRTSYPFARELALIASLPYRAAKGAIIEGHRGRRLVTQTVASQVYFTAVQPLPQFATIALVFGFLVHVGSDSFLRSRGFDTEVSEVAVVGLVREILPLVLALVLIGRSGTAIATELGYMRVNKEVAGLDAVGINTDYFLALPRIIGLVLSSLGLLVVMAAIAIVGGYALANVLSFISVAYEFNDVLDAFTFGMIFTAMAKAILFGVVIGTVSTHFGLSVGTAYTEIPRVNARSTMYCMLLCFVVDLVLSLTAFL